MRISTRSSVKDLWRITQEPLRENLSGFQQDFLIRACAKSCKNPLVDVSRIFTTSSDKDLYKITQGHPTGFHYETLVKIFLYYAPWNPCKGVIEGHSSEFMRSRFQDPRESAKIMTAPQRERSDTHKVLRGLCEQCQNSHRTTTRAIWHAQSPGGLREHMLDFYKTLRAPRNMNIEHVKSDFFVEVYKKEPKSDEMDIQ